MMKPDFARGFGTAAALALSNTSPAAIPASIAALISLCS